MSFTCHLTQINTHRQRELALGPLQQLNVPLSWFVHQSFVTLLVEVCPEVGFSSEPLCLTWCPLTSPHLFPKHLDEHV